VSKFVILLLFELVGESVRFCCWLSSDLIGDVVSLEVLQLRWSWIDVRDADLEVVFLNSSCSSPSLLASSCHCCEL